ncbi:MAG: hypothetical protein ACWGMZ_12910 [Thermoguttaceae bacterium]
MLWAVVASLVFLVVLFYCWPQLRDVSREARFSQARKRFHPQRERLEAKFIRLASRRSKTHSPRWCDCTFADDVSYVRNRKTGELSAFVAVSLMADDIDARNPGNSYDAIGNLLLGTAVFRYDGIHWETEGRAILNLSPTEAFRRFQNDLEMVGEELGKMG